MKKLLFTILAIFGFASIAFAAQPILSSWQIGNTPTNGYYLQTNGVTSSWQPVASGSGSISTSTPVTAQSGLSFWTGVNTLSGTTSPTVGYITATSTTANSMFNGTLSLPLLGTPAGSFVAVDPNGQVIATTSPKGSPAGINASINVATLTANITLTAGTDPMYQYLNPSTANWTITLDTASANVGDRFVIKDTDAYTSAYTLSIYQSTTLLDTIHSQGSKVFIFDGANWAGAENGSGNENNIGFGYGANGANAGVAVGNSANGSNYGSAFGYNANASSNGVAIGFGSNGSTNGTALGYSSNGLSNGVAVGHNSNGNTNGTSVGYYSNGSNSSTALGYYAGNGQTGSKNINVGQYVTSPTLSGTQQLNIGNLLYGTGIYGGSSVSSVPVLGGKIGIGTTNPTARLTIQNNTATSSPIISLYDSTGAVSLEIRASTSTLSNTFVGAGAGKVNTTGGNNSAQGYMALYKNTTGSQNSAQGTRSLYNNTTGTYNSAQGAVTLYSNTTGSNNSAQGAVSLNSNTTGYNNSAQGAYALNKNTTGYNNSTQGYQSLYSNTTGTSNSAQGYYALRYNTVGYRNTAQGSRSLYNNLSGIYNSAQGVYALYNNTTGSSNTAQGYGAGMYIADGATANTTSGSSLYLGASTKALTSGDTNETVIGYNATGIGSNSVVLGNDSVLTTALKGNVGIGTTSPYENLSVVGNGVFTGKLTANGVNAGINTQTLIANTTITPGSDPMYQYLNPSTSNWTVKLATSTANAGDRFIIKNNDINTSAYFLSIYQGNTFLDNIYARQVKIFIFDGINWQGADNGVKDKTLGIGYNTKSYNSGTSIGYQSVSDNQGVAIGYTANGETQGAAFGNGSYAKTYGSAIGYNANGSTYGAAFGNTARGYTYGAAVGYQANGSSYGSSIGYYSNGSSYGTAIGYYAGNGQSGSQNINIGQYVTSPTLAGNQQLNIGNVLYGTGMYNGTSVSSVPVAGKIGIGTTTPSFNLSIQATTATTTISNGSSTSASCMQMYSPNGTAYAVYIGDTGTLTSKAGSCN